MKQPMKYALKDFTDPIEMMMRDETMRSCTVFLLRRTIKEDVKQRVRVTRRGDDSLIVKYGRPNYDERQYLVLCKKAKCMPRRLLFKFYKEQTKKRRR